MEWILPILVASAFAAPTLQRRLGDRAGILLALVPGSVALHALWAQGSIARGEIASFRGPWIPSLGVDWAFRVDGLANLLILLIAGIGALILVYAAGYLRGNPRLGRLYASLLLFMVGMLGVVAADDLLLLFVFWELTTVSSFLMIGFQQEKEAARSAALTSLLVTGSGGLALLAGMLLLVAAGGTSSISGLVAQADAIQAHPHYGWILGLVLAGAFTKSAQFPFHFWLPAAMAAPTPVSAYLHSATMVKAGVFLLARLSPVLGGTDAWLLVVSSVGATTMLLGAFLALGQDDLKRILAYTTVSVLGLLTLLVGLGTPIAARAFAVTLLAHALYKSTLFLVAGNLDFATGTRSLERLRGLRSAMPWTATAALVAGVSMAGAPPLFGFLAKETAYEAALEAPRWSVLFGPATVAAAVCLVFAALRVGLRPFAGTPGSDAPEGREVPRALRVGPVVLALAGLMAGSLVGPAERWIIAPAAEAILQQEVPTGLALWHGFTPILALSVATLALGFALFRAQHGIAAAGATLTPLARVGPGRIWDRGWELLLGAARWQTGVLQNGSLRRYLGVTLSVAFAAALVGLADAASLVSIGDDLPITAIGGAAGLLIIGGALLMLATPTPLVAVAALGAVGFGVALLFLVYSAPDLALTQLVVEVLTVVLLVFIARRLPAARPLRWTEHRPGAVALAVLGGVTMGMLSLLAFQVQLAEPISAFFNEQSVPAAYGRNVVNVILVDFRALDTLGEIAVLAVAALGIVALLARRRAAANEGASA